MVCVASCFGLFAATRGSGSTGARELEPSALSGSLARWGSVDRLGSWALGALGALRGALRGTFIRWSKEARLAGSPEFVRTHARAHSNTYQACVPESDSPVPGRVLALVAIPVLVVDLSIAVWTLWTAWAIWAVDTAPPRRLSVVQPGHALARALPLARLASRPCSAFSATTVDVGTCNHPPINFVCSRRPASPPCD